MRRDPRKAEALLRALARNTATLVTNKAIKWDISEGSGSISMPTIAAYLTALKRIYVLEEIPAWSPNVRAKTRMRTSPKRMLTDPSLAAASLGVSVERLLVDTATMGMLFENLCYRDLLVYAGLNDAAVLHYHDDSEPPRVLWRVLLHMF